MKHSPQIYADAFEKVLEGAALGHAGVLARRFAQIIYKKGDIKYGEKIVEAVQNKLIKKNGGRRVKVEYARQMQGAGEDACEKLFSSRDRVDVVINPALIAGVRITIDGEKEIDYSLQRKLKKMFQN